MAFLFGVNGRSAFKWHIYSCNGMLYSCVLPELHVKVIRDNVTFVVH